MLENENMLTLTYMTALQSISVTHQLLSLSAGNFLCKAVQEMDLFWETTEIICYILFKSTKMCKLTCVGITSVPTSGTLGPGMFFCSQWLNVRISIKPQL